MKGNKPTVNRALLAPRQLTLKVLEGSWADMHRIFLNCFYVFYYQFTNRSNEVLLKNVTDKHMVMVELLLIRLQLFNMNN